MRKNIKIKIVKKNEAVGCHSEREKKNKPHNAAREMVSTVSDWVADLKVRKSAEAKAAFDIFRASNPRPSES